MHCSQCLSKYSGATKHTLICKVSSKTFVGFGKRDLLEKGSFQKIHFLEILENLEILGNPPVQDKGESDHFLEILENMENLENLEIPPPKRPLFLSRI